MLDRIDCETQYIFSNDSDFINQEMGKFLVIIPNLNVFTIFIFNKEKEKNKERGLSFNIDDLRKKVDIYYSLIRRNLNDSIPKMIGFFLIKNIQVHLNLL